MSQWKFADNSDSDKKPADSPAPASPPAGAPLENSDATAPDAYDALMAETAAPSPSPPATLISPAVPASPSASPFQFQPSADPPASPPPTAKKPVAAPPSVATPAVPAPTGSTPGVPTPQPPSVPTANVAASSAPTAPSVRVPSPMPPPRNPSPSATGAPSPAAPRVGGVPSVGAQGAAPAPPSAVPSPMAPNAGRPAASGPAAGGPVAPTPPAPVPSPTYGAPASTNTGIPQIAAPRTPVKDETMSAWQGREVLEKIAPFAAWLFRICMGLFLFSLVYLVFGLLSSGKIISDSTAALPQAPTSSDANAVTSFNAMVAAHSDSIAEAKTLIQNAHTASIIFTWALVGVSLSLVVLAFDLGAIGAIVAGVGAVLLFLGPVGIFGMFGKNLVTTSIINGLIAPPALLAVITVGMLKLLADVFIFFTSVPEKMRTRASVGVPQPAEAKQRLAAANANMFSPCWQLPFCREVVRKQCPAFLAKKRCWKFGRGCYCDEEMISRIIRGESLEVIKSPTRMSQQGKPPCGKCHIYLEHQRHKFRWLSPLSIPATAAMMFFGWPVYLAAFALFWKGVSPLFAAVSFDPKDMSTKMGFDQNGTENNFNQISPQQMHDITLNGLAVIVGILALIYISKAVEWIVYKLQW